MTNSSYFYVLWLLVLQALSCLPCTAAIAATEPPPADTPKTSLLVSLSRASLRENDDVSVTIWFSNDSAVNFTSANLLLPSPEKLTWQDASCKDQISPNTVPLPAVPSHQVVSRMFCLKSGSEVDVGNLNLLFTVKFSWQTGTTSQEGFVSTEKPLNVALLGTDTLGGVPISIASLIVPGLLFWMAVNFWGATWGPGVALGDKLIYSVLASAVIMVLLSSSFYFNLKSGLSVWKLFYLALIGAGLGLVVGFVDWLIRKTGEKKKEARTAEYGDDAITALGKLLRLHQGKQIAQVRVRLKDGKQFLGSLGESRADLVTLVGWFAINTTGLAEDVIKELREILSRSQYAALFDAVENKSAIELSDAIKEIDGAGNSITTGSDVRFWKPDVVEELVPVAGAPKRPPLQVA